VTLSACATPLLRLQGGGAPCKSTFHSLQRGGARCNSPAHSLQGGWRAVQIACSLVAGGVAHRTNRLLTRCRGGGALCESSPHSLLGGWRTVQSASSLSARGWRTAQIDPSLAARGWRTAQIAFPALQRARATRKSILGSRIGREYGASPVRTRRAAAQPRECRPPASGSTRRRPQDASIGVIESISSSASGLPFAAFARSARCFATVATVRRSTPSLRAASR